MSDKINGLKMVSIRLVENAPLMSEEPITKAEDAVRLIGKELCKLDREVLCVINLKANGQPINCNIVSIGAVDYSVAEPRELLKSAILSNATRMIIVHNHPSSTLVPSKQDTIITDRMCQVGNMMGIKLVDHIIVGGDNTRYFSFAEQGILPFMKDDYETDYKKINIEKEMVAEPDVNTVRVRRRR